jgi:hypothetical protein
VEVVGLAQPVRNKGDLMSINVSYTKVCSVEDAYNLVKENITPETIAKYNVKADFEYIQHETIVAKGKGFQLTLKFESSCCKGDLNLAFMFKPFKGKITDSITRQLSKIL